MEKNKTANRHIEDCYMCRPTQQKFNEAVTSYIEKIFSQQIESGFTYILLDQAISPNNTQVIHRYFKKAKMIIVTRDPRDMYVDDVRWGENLEKDLNSEEAGLRYALKQKALREGIVIDKDILTISFENLCLEYDNSVKKIEDLIGLTSKNHVTPKKYFKPEVSSKNVGIWKNEYEKYRKAIDKIYEIIPQYCTQK